MLMKPIANNDVNKDSLLQHKTPINVLFFPYTFFLGYAVAIGRFNSPNRDGILSLKVF